MHSSEISLCSPWVGVGEEEPRGLRQWDDYIIPQRSCTTEHYILQGLPIFFGHFIQSFILHVFIYICLLCQWFLFLSFWLL